MPKATNGEATSKTANKKTKMSVEPSTRTLRARQTPAPVAEKAKKTGEKTVKRKQGKKSEDEPKIKVSKAVDDGESEEVKPKKKAGKGKAAKKNDVDDDLSEEEDKPKKAAKSKAALKNDEDEEVSDEGKPLKKPTKGKKTAAENEDDEEENEADAANIYEFKATTIEGKEISLDKYKGHVCIIVNVASKCGHTSANYKEFVELYEKFNDKGLKILAFPCNQFGKQEPGDNDKICEFAKKKNVNFDMFAKIDVNGKKAHPLWKYLTSKIDGPKGSAIEWNFTKFLIDKDGQVVERFKPAIKPSALVKELEKLW